MTKKIAAHEQAVLFQFIVEGRLPSWAKNDPRKAFARLMNKTQKWADSAYERAYHAGYLGKTNPREGARSEK